MKIHEGKGPLIQQATRGVKGKSSNGYDFKVIMDQVNYQSRTGETSSGPEKSIPPMNNITLLNIGDPVVQAGSQDKVRVVSLLHETLDMVDFYAGKLSDKSLPVEGLNPLVKHLEDRLETLKDLESTHGVPEKLKPVLSDMTVTIGAEIEKFKRGDYL